GLEIKLAIIVLAYRKYIKSSSVRPNTDFDFYYIGSGLRRLSPPRGAGWEPENIRIFRAKKSQPPRLVAIPLCGTSDAVTMRLFGPLEPITTMQGVSVGSVGGNGRIRV